MEFFRTISLPFTKELATEAEAIMQNDCNTEFRYIKHLTVSEDLKVRMNNYLASRNISEVSEVIVFKKRFTKVAAEYCHIDGHSARRITKCAIIVPVANCKNTGQFWFDGDYDVVEKSVGEINYTAIQWKSTPALSKLTEIYESPIIARVNVPHEIFNHNKDSYRITCSIRFKDNEDYDYAAKALS